MKIIAIIVSFRPDIELLKKTISSLQFQVNNIIIINNDTDDLQFDISQIDISQNILINNLKNNFGIAYAQNIGIKKAIELEANYILLSDQDTIYPESYINQFLPYLNGNKASLYCPVFFDNVRNVYSSIKIEKFKSVPFVKEPTFVQQAIASGSIIDVKCLDKVGLMDENLFIDYVDFEFCWRLTKSGYKILTIPSIIVNHQLGDGIKKILNIKVTLRSDIRYFYIMRNGFYLALHCKYLSFLEKMSLLKKTILFSCVIFLLKHNFKSIKLVLSALYDGITCKLGKKELLK